MTARPFSFSKDWSTSTEDERSRLAECGCRPPGDPCPRYVILDRSDIRTGEWACPH